MRAGQSPSGTGLPGAAQAGQGRRDLGCNEDDRAFRAWVAAIDDADAQAPGIEEALANADATPLPPEFIEDAIARATASTPLGLLRRRTLAAAALLVGAMVLTAATAVVLLWPERRDSPSILSYGDAISLTQRSSRIADYGSAFLVVQGRIVFGIEALAKVWNDPDEDTSLRESAREALTSLQARVDNDAREGPGQVTQEVAAFANDVTNRGLAQERRKESLVRLVRLLSQGILAIKFPAGSSPESVAFASYALQMVRKALAGH